MLLGKSYDEIVLGEKAAFTKTMAESDVYTFAGITGDLNPAHINESHAAQTFFKKRIVHGMLISGLISSVLGMHLPGPGTIYMKQSLNFLAPVYFGDTITAEVEVIEKIEEKKRLRLKTTCTNQDGVVVVDGEALVSPPRK